MTVFRKNVEKPTFYTAGKCILDKPQFNVNNTTKLTFSWQLKCLAELPELSIRIVKISQGVGIHAKDMTAHFKLPELFAFTALKAPSLNSSAIRFFDGEIEIVDTASIPVGRFSMEFEMIVLAKTHKLHQNFQLIRK